jgi:hypothetical protein
MRDQDREQAIEHEQDDSLTKEQAAKAGTIVETIDRLWEQDHAAYREAYILTGLRASMCFVWAKGTRAMRCERGRSAFVG